MRIEDNQANIKNANKCTPGTNEQYDKKHGNRGKQLNKNYKNRSEAPKLEEDYPEDYHPGIDGPY